VGKNLSARPQAATAWAEVGAERQTATNHQRGLAKATDSMGRK